MYHVYNRFSSGEAYFADPNDAIDFVEAIGVYRCPVTLYGPDERVPIVPRTRF